jgi:hypothetical protein
MSDFGYVYVLKLQQDKWYIGFEIDEYESHQIMYKHNTAWTRMYDPIECSVLHGTRKFEKVLALQYMAMYGSDNVRSDNWPETGNFSEPNKLKLLEYLNA